MPEYFTNLDITGGIRFNQVPASIGIVERLHDQIPIGMASLVGHTDEGLALWQLNVRGAPVPGRWVVLGKWFVADEG
jgi:hypothetical protein